MNPNKAPGPDGMIPTFYQKHWAIVREYVVKLTRKFFQYGVLDADLNRTNIVLIPKKKQTVTVGDLRPIALC